MFLVSLLIHESAQLLKTHHHDCARFCTHIIVQCNSLKPPQPEKYRTTTLRSLKSSWENKTNTPEAMKSGQNRVKTELGIQTPDTLKTPRSTHFISCKAKSDNETLAWDSPEDIPTDTWESSRTRKGCWRNEGV